MDEILGENLGLVAWILLILFIALGVYYLLKKRNKKKREDVRERLIEVFMRSLSYVLSNKDERAIQELIEAAKLDSSSVETYFTLGQLFRRKGFVDRAIAIHKNLNIRLKKNHPLRVESLYQLALDYKTAGMYDRALSVLEELVSEKSNKRLLDAYFLLMEIYTVLKDYSKAEEISKNLEKQLETAEQKEKASYMLAEIGEGYLKSGDLKSARSCLRRALKMNPGCGAAYLGLLEYRARKQDLDGLFRIIEDIEKEAPDFMPMILDKCQDIFFDSGRFEDYEEFIRRKAKDENIKGDPYRVALCQIYYRAGKADLARDELLKLLNNGHGGSRVKKLLARIIMDNKIEDSERRLLEELTTLKEGFVCRSCSYKFSRIYWKCPRCQAWGSVIPLS